MEQFPGERISDSRPSPLKSGLIALRDAFRRTGDSAPLMEEKNSEGSSFLLSSAMGLLDSREFPHPVYRRFLRKIISFAALEREHGGYVSGEEGAAAIDYLLSRIAPPPSRETLFTDLLGIVAAARAGSGDAYLLTAPSGYGKSVLWHTVIFETRRPEEVWSYYKSPQKGVSPYAVVARLLEGTLRSMAERTGRDPQQLLDDLLAGLPIRGTVEALLRSLISPDLEGPATDRPVLNSAVDYAAGLADLLRALGRNNPSIPVVIVVDDLQWCDDQSVEVLRELARDPAGLGLIMIGRPEGSSRMDGLLSLRKGVIPPLERQESAELLAFLIAADPQEWSDRSLLSWLAEYSRGNPLELTEGFRNAVQTVGLARPIVMHENTGSLMEERLKTVTKETHRFLEDLAFLLPPVSETLARKIPLPDGATMESVLKEAEEEELISWNRDSREISFRHDAMETAFRRQGEGDSERFTEASRILKESVSEGDYQARYVLARLLAPDSENGEQRFLSQRIGLTFSPEESVAILSESAKRAVDFISPKEALRFAQRALELGGAVLTERDTLKLDIVAHRAAFLLDDGVLMSHHFRRITALGSPLEVNRARIEWISRSYTKLWIRGALRIGWRILHELGAVESGNLAEEGSRLREIAAARAFFHGRSPELLSRRLGRSRKRPTEQSQLITRIAATLLTPVLTLDPERVPVMGWIIFCEALGSGPSEYAGFGFIYWSIYRSQRGATAAQRHLPARMALLFAERPEVSEAARAATESYAAIFGIHWQEDHRRTAERYLSLYRKGISAGSYEWACHAVHLYCQSLFFRGEPLREVYDVLDGYRRRIAELGLSRIAKALSKFQQAAESLSGGTGDPLTLGGTLFREDDLRRELLKREDRLGMSGFHILKGILAAYGDEAERAFEHFHAFASTREIHGAMNTVTFFRFFYGFFAWRVGEAEVGEASLRVIRRLGSRAYGDHRLLALKAERANSRGKRRRADRRFAAARRAAHTDGFPNEAALIGERHGRLLLEWARSGGAGATSMRQRGAEALHIAHSLYREWGAEPAAARVASALRGVSTAAGAVTSSEGEAETTRETGAVGTAPLAERLDDTSRRLANTQKNAILLFTIISEALLLIDQRERLLFHNSAAVEYIDNLQGGDPRQEGGARISAALDSLFGELLRRAFVTRESVEDERVWGDRTLRVAVSPAPGEEGMQVAAVVIRDVSEIRRREQELIVADRMYSLGLLASTVAHEVGNPNHILQLNAQTLSMILGSLENEPSWLGKAQEAVENILYGAHRIDEVVRQVKEYGRGGREEEWELLNPADIGGRVLRFSQMMVKKYTTELLYEEGQDLPPIRAARGLLEQALINLVANACEAIPDRSARVCLRLEAEESSVLFAVCDQGPGFSDDLSGRVGEPFSTTRGASGGTGLGLSIVRSIISRHDGTLTFTGDSTYNTIAEVRIPRGTVERGAGGHGSPSY